MNLNPVSEFIIKNNVLHLQETLDVCFEKDYNEEGNPFSKNNLISNFEEVLAFLKDYMGLPILDEGSPRSKGLKELKPTDIQKDYEEFVNHHHQKIVQTWNASYILTMFPPDQEVDFHHLTKMSKPVDKLPALNGEYKVSKMHQNFLKFFLFFPYLMWKEENFELEGNNIIVFEDIVLERFEHYLVNS